MALTPAANGEPNFVQIDLIPDYAEVDSRIGDRTGSA